MMKNNNFKRKIELKTLLDDASSDHIESFIEKNKNSSISDDMLENIKSKVFEKTGIKTACEKETANKKGKKTHLCRLLYAAACVLLALAVAVGAKYINFGNNPPAVSTDESNAISAGTESYYSGDNSNESQNTTQDEPFEIKGINWDNLSDEDSKVHGGSPVLNGVDVFLDNPKAQNDAWVVAVLKGLEPIGKFERYYTYEDGRKTQFPDLYLSMAEIEIRKIYYYGDFEGKITENQTVNILVTCIVENNEIKETFSSYSFESTKEIIDIPMTEIGKEYVIGICDVINPSIKEAIKDIPNNDDLLLVEYSYPIFSCDLSQIKNLNDFKIMACYPQMYVAVYDRYMKGIAPKDSNETKAYNYFKDDVYRIFGETPMKPKWEKFISNAQKK